MPKFKFQLNIKADPLMRVQIIASHQGVVTIPPSNPPVNPTEDDWIEAIENYYEEMIADRIVSATFDAEESPEDKKRSIRERLKAKTQGIK